MFSYIYIFYFATSIIQFSKIYIHIISHYNKAEIMVGLNGLEPSTSRLSGVRSNQLSYRPIMVETRRIELLTPCLQGRCSPN